MHPPFRSSRNGASLCILASFAWRDGARLPAPTRHRGTVGEPLPVSKRRLAKVVSLREIQRKWLLASAPESKIARKSPINGHLELRDCNNPHEN